jgi:hypothetical protein
MHFIDNAQIIHKIIRSDKLGANEEHISAK